MSRRDRTDSAIHRCGCNRVRLALYTLISRSLIVLCFSDTKLVAKSLVADMTAVAPTLWTTVTGRRSLLYLVAPRSRKHFMPAQIVTLAETDAIRATTSKKDEDIRAAEIRRAASEKLLEFIAQHGVEVVKDTAGSLVVTEIMLQTEGGSYPSSVPQCTPH